MLNSTPVNAPQGLNVGLPGSTIFTGLLRYGDYGMPNPNCRIRLVEGIDDSPDIDADVYDIANTHGQGLRNFLYKGKPIKVEGTLYAADKDGLAAAKRSLIAAIAVPDQMLRRVEPDGEQVESRAYAARWVIPNLRYTTNFVRFTVYFIVLDPFFYSTVVNQAAFEWVSSNIDSALSHTGGTYEVKPKIIIAFGAGTTGVTSITATINGEAIVVTEAISGANTVIIDAETQDVSLNSVGGKDYTGIFPILNRGDNPVTIDIDGTRTADIYIQWKNAYV